MNAYVIFKEGPAVYTDSSNRMYHFPNHIEHRYLSVQGEFIQTLDPMQDPHVLKFVSKYQAEKWYNIIMSNNHPQIKGADTVTIMPCSDTSPGSVSLIFADENGIESRIPVNRVFLDDNTASRIYWRGVREALGLKTVDVAVGTAIAPSTISRFEKHGIRPDIQHAIVAFYKSKLKDLSKERLEIIKAYANLKVMLEAQ